MAPRSSCSPARLRTKKDAKKPNFRELDKSDHEAIRRRRASANRTLTVLKAALNRAWREGKIPSDEAWRRVEPFEEVDAARVRYLTVAEAKRLLNACDPDFRRLAQAALVTGARYGELTALRASDFNPDSGTIHVRTSKSGKGRHIVLNDEGVALFKSLAAGKSGDAVLLSKADGSPLETRPSSAPDDGSVQAGEDRAACVVPCFAAHVGFASGHGRRPAHGGRPQSRPCRHADGRTALRPSWRRATSRTRSAPRHQNSASSLSAMWFRSRQARRLNSRRIGIASPHGWTAPDVRLTSATGQPNGLISPTKSTSAAG